MGLFSDRHIRRRQFAAAAAALSFTVLAGVAGSRIAHAWGAGGHMMVADIAYDRLNPHAKSEVDRLLKMPDPAGIAKIDDDPRTNFIRVSTWADSLRNAPDFRYTAAEHFIDQPLAGDDSNTPLPAIPADNVLVALQKCVTVLKDPAAKDSDKALQLRLLIHFVGDIHQPLHAATRVTKENPDGDKGGNSFYLANPNGDENRRAPNLHSYWDGGLGAFPAVPFRSGRFNQGNGSDTPPPPPPGVAVGGTPPPAGGGQNPQGQRGSFRAFPQLPIADIDKAVGIATAANPESNPAWHSGTGVPYDFSDWASESKALAVSAVYADLKENTVPSKAYVERGQAASYQRVAWAGYRLAALLNDLYPASTAPASAAAK